MTTNPNNNEKNKLRKLLEYDTDIIKSNRENMARRLEHVKVSPKEAQIAFIKELVKSPKEMDIFLKDPKKYAVDHGILLSPELIKSINNTILFDVTLDEKLQNELGENALRDIVDLREGRATGVMSNAVAAAAVVAAAAAVATAVVTVVRTSRPSDLHVLQGLGENGITLPNGERFIARDWPSNPN